MTNINGIVYKYTNKVSDNSYIGLTTLGLEERKRLGYYGAFKHAINKYGWRCDTIRKYINTDKEYGGGLWQL